MSAAQQERLKAARSFLAELGYGAELVKERFPVWLGADNVRHVDLVAFSVPAPQDMTTSSLVASLDPHTDAMVLARTLASPFAVLADDIGLHLWRTGSEPANDEPLTTTPYESARGEAALWRDRLAPHLVGHAKSTARQMTLIPIDVQLLGKARLRSMQNLGALVDEAMGAVLQGSAPETASEFDKASRLVVAALAALMIRDKLGITGELEADTLTWARLRFPKYFSWLDELPEADHSRLHTALSILGEGVDYTSLSPGLVTHVYEEAVVDEAIRTDLGVYYTPPELANRIAAHVPFEELPPEDRRVLDPTCGSGTLLLSAYERLDEALSPEWDIFQRHEYLQKRLLGYDIDRFAVEVARLALLANAMPAGDDWRIHQGDARDELPVQPPPSIIISNPPWKNVRSLDGRRQELADHFVRRMVDALAPGGFLAVILPATWLTSDASRDTRDYLTRKARLFEVWRLPESVFEKSAAASCVVLARLGERTDRYLFRRVLSRPGSVSRFVETGIGDELFLVSTNGSDDNGRLRLPGPLETQIAGLEELETLDSVALVQNGPPTARARAMPGHGPYLWLRYAGALTEFGDVPDDALLPVRYPEDFSKRGTNVDVYLQPKVLVSATRSSENPWRLKVSLDHLGVIPRNSLHMVIPRSRHDLFALLAVLGSSFASAWVDTHEASRNIRVAVLASLPLPHRSTWRSLASIGRQLNAQAQDGEIHPDLLERLEHVVGDAYDLRDDVRAALQSHFAHFQAPEGRQRFAVPLESVPEPVDSRPRRVGAVLGVDEGRILLWVPGVTNEEGDWLTPPRRFLGWHCHDEATFDVLGSDEGLEWAIFRFQRKSYRQRSELVRDLEDNQ